MLLSLSHKFLLTLTFKTTPFQVFYSTVCLRFSRLASHTNCLHAKSCLLLHESCLRPQPSEYYTINGHQHLLLLFPLFVSVFLPKTLPVCSPSLHACASILHFPSRRPPHNRLNICHHSSS